MIDFPPRDFSAQPPALLKISARRVKIAFASARPNDLEWRLAAARLAHARPSPA
jgi:hypothetical protein